MQTKQLCVLIHNRLKVGVGTVKHLSPLVNLVNFPIPKSIYISQLIRFAKASSNLTDLSNSDTF